MDVKKLSHTDISILIPVCSEASRKAHTIAIEEAKKYPERFYEIYLAIYNYEFNKLYKNILKQFE
uniref:Uncharacterized protein n=1 Tax=viral metagenome TaxID=1070528 RepID=A0A6C0LQH0_9ZZZZ